MELKGLYMHVPECGHTYGISSINEPDLYDRLRSLFFQNRGGRWFLQSESERTCLGDKSFLFIEFLGQSLNDDSALEQCEQIASELRVPLNIL
jgi:hypothetical protein